MHFVAMQCKFGCKIDFVLTILSNNAYVGDSIRIEYIIKWAFKQTL